MIPVNQLGRPATLSKAIRTVVNPTSINYGLLRRYLSVKNTQDIKSLEDLAKLQSLNDVDPELIKKLIDERTSELNIKNELEMLKTFNKEDDLARQSPLKKFTRPLWIFLLMSSTVYLFGHLIWWNLEYEERELELATKVQGLEAELNQLLLEQKPKESKNIDNTKGKRLWYQRWFW